VQWIARPQRFPLELPVSYRNAAGGEWQAGLTLEVSTSGAVLRITHAAAALTPALILVITLPFGDGCLVGKGHVVRTAAGPAEIGAANLVVTIEESQIVHRRAVTAATDSLLGMPHVDVR